MSKRSVIGLAMAGAVFLAPGAYAGNAPLGGVISEFKATVVAHDVARDNHAKDGESGTVDLGGEILFVPLKFANPENKFLRMLAQPRPHIGGLANTEGHTSHGYFGLTWDYRFESNIFIEFGFGFGIHDGQLKGKVPPNDRPNLGSPVLFREGLDLGYRFDGSNSLSVFVSHLSNAGWLAKENDGMNFIGMRYGYRFD